MFRQGDRVAWHRASGAAHATILEVKGERTQRAKLQVDGWVGAIWETLDGQFEDEATFLRRESERAGAKRKK